MELTCNETSRSIIFNEFNEVNGYILKIKSLLIFYFSQETKYEKSISVLYIWLFQHEYEIFFFPQFAYATLNENTSFTVYIVASVLGSFR